MAHGGQQVDGAVEGRWGTGGDQHVVGQVATRRLGDDGSQMPAGVAATRRAAGRVSSWICCVGGAEAQCGVALVDRRVHGHDRVGAGETGRLDGADTHTSAAHHDHRVAGGHPGRVGNRPRTGKHATTQ